MASLRKDFQSMMVFLKAQFLVLHFSYYISMVFLIFVILPSMLMILLSTLSVIRHLICDNNESWLLAWNLTYETLFDFKAGKTQPVWFDQFKNSGAIDMKMDGCFYGKIIFEDAEAVFLF